MHFGVCRHAESARESGGGGGARSRMGSILLQRISYVWHGEISARSESVRNLELNYICNSSSIFLLFFFSSSFLSIFGSCIKLECDAHVCFVVAISLHVTCIVYPYFNFHMEVSFFSLAFRR